MERFVIIQGGILDRNGPDFAKKRWEANEKYLPYRIMHESWWPQELPSEEENCIYKHITESEVLGIITTDEPPEGWFIK